MGDDRAGRQGGRAGAGRPLLPLPQHLALGGRRGAGGKPAHPTGCRPLPVGCTPVFFLLSGLGGRSLPCGVQGKKGRDYATP